MYRYLELDPTFKQTKRVLDMLRKLPGPESTQNMMPDKIHSTLSITSKWLYILPLAESRLDCFMYKISCKIKIKKIVTFISQNLSGIENRNVNVGVI